MGHYYTNDDNLINEEYHFDYDYKGVKYRFESNTGVFSKKRVDFGTNVLINALPDFESGSLLDMGCGVGVISIVLAGANKNICVTGCDVNKKALELANKNAIKNKLTNVTFLESNLYDNINDEFDYIVSNPPIRAGKKIVHGVVIDGFNHLKDGGNIYLVIQTKQGAPSLKEKMNEVFGNVSVIDKKNGYLILSSKKEN